MFTNTLGIRLELWIGPSPLFAAPAPTIFTQAIDSIEISDDEEGSGFQINFRVTKNFLGEYTLLANPLLTASSRIIIGVWLGAKPYVLIDGVVSHQQLKASDQPGSSMLSVSGRDFKSIFDLIENTIPYEAQPDSVIIASILARYSMYGIVPSVISKGLVPLSSCPWQVAETDLHYIQRLAKKQDAVFYITPIFFGTSRAYFGPDPTWKGLPQHALTVHMGANSNLLAIDFSYQPTKPALATAEYYPPQSVASVPMVPTPPVRIPPFAARPTPPKRLMVVRDTPNYDFAGVAMAVKAAANRSLDAVTADGQIDTLRYGRVLRTFSTVGVRGAGQAFDGIYAVNSVQHHISRDKYTQEFSLRREGLYSLTPELL